MKRFKKIYILLGILLVACIATFAVSRMEEKKEQIKNSNEIILEVPTDSVQALSWEYGDTALSFYKEDNWLYEADEAFPVDADKISALLEQFQAFGASFIIEEVEDYGQYGLDDPTCTIQLTTEDQTYEILLGGYSTMDAQRYVSIGDGNVYLAASDPLDSFDVTISDLIQHDTVPSLTQVARLQFEGVEEYTAVYEEDSGNTYCADDVYFVQRDGEPLPLDTSRVKSYCSTIRYLSLTDYVTYNATEEELQAYGLDDPELTVTVDYVTEDEDGEETTETFVLSVSRAAEEKEAGEDAETVTAYARVGDSPIVYQISASEYTALMAASYDDLRHREVLTASFEDMLQIDITLEDTTYTLTAADGEEDGERVWLYQEAEVDTASLQSALENLSVAEFTDEQPGDKLEISLTVYLDNENFPEVQVELYRYDGTNCLAVVDGQPVSLVARSSVVDLMEAVYAIILNPEASEA